MARPQLQGALTNTPVLISSVPCTLTAVHGFNNANAAGFLQLFNTNAAANVTLSSTTPEVSFGTATLTSIHPDLGTGVYFPKGLVAAATTTVNGSSALSAAMTVNFVVA